jgi:hypothetical protein
LEESVFLVMMNPHIGRKLSLASSISKFHTFSL